MDRRIPIVGPMADATAQTAASIPINVPRSLSGTRSAMIMSVRDPMPAAPTPWMADQKVHQFSVSKRLTLLRKTREARRL